MRCGDATVVEQVSEGSDEDDRPLAGTNSGSAKY